MIKDFVPRLYQETILNTASKKNTLVVLPTGMGKTNIFLMLAALRMQQYPNSKVMFIGPTRPLIDQYYEVFKKHMDIEEEKMAIFTGMVSPEKRAEMWKQAKVIFSTPQGLENDIITRRINLEEVSLLGVDEAHRAVGNYSYVFIAKQYHDKSKFPRIIALTASPGSDMETIKEVCQNLFIEEIEVRTNEDADVKPYVQEIKMEWKKVSLPPAFIEIQTHVKLFLKRRMAKLKDWGVLKRAEVGNVSRKDILDLQAQVRGRIASGEKDFVMWNAISVLAEIMKIYHALELLETQGITSLYTYLSKIQQDGMKSTSKAVTNIVNDIDFKNALYKTRKLFDEKIEHPKLIELQKIVQKEISENPDLKMIIFNQYRENAAEIRDIINKINGVRSEIFVGQQKKGDTGLSQKKQKEMLDKFRQGDINIIVATSIGEEGLDIPKVDIVVFYEPVPSAIRAIQRRGRTGRNEKGRVIILMTEKTRDETYRWAEKGKERRMYDNMANIKKELKLQIMPKEKPLNSFEHIKEEDRIQIIVDHREKANAIVKELMHLGANVKLEQLTIGDYVLSQRVGVEFKTVEDFVNSIVDGRLLVQIKTLYEKYKKPVLIIQGGEDIYSVRNVHPNAIRGMIATIIISYGIPVIMTRNEKESAALLFIIAKREQEIRGKEFNPHQEKPTQTLRQQQEYIVSSLPNIGPKAARELLQKFNSVKNVMNASQEELEEVPKVGKILAKKIREVIDSEYERKED